MKTARGMIALLISYMIFHGWAVLFFVSGVIVNNTWLIAIGSAVILFWFGPGTPVIPLVIITALGIQRYLLMDHSQRVSLKEKWKELNQNIQKNKHHKKND